LRKKIQIDGTGEEGGRERERERERAEYLDLKRKEVNRTLEKITR